jgi:hypothetical protein
VCAQCKNKQIKQIEQTEKKKEYEKNLILEDDGGELLDRQIGFIYIISCRHGDEVRNYVGQTSGPMENRRLNHITSLTKHNHYNLGLQYCWNNEWQMSMGILEKVFSNGITPNSDILHIEENKWILFLGVEKDLNIKYKRSPTDDYERQERGGNNGMEEQWQVGRLLREATELG